MAINIFSTAPGVAAVINDPAAVPMALYIGGWGNFNLRKAILFGVSFASQANAQILHTIAKYTYVYVFGERMGDIRVTGITLLNRCNELGADGASGVLQYYANNALSATGQGVLIGIGLARFYGLLMRVRLVHTNPETQIGQFELGFQSLAT